MAALIGGADIGFTGITLAFGLAIVAAAYAVGAVAGAHLNPAVSLGMLAAGRMREFVGYAVAQIAGAGLGALVLYLIASCKPGFVMGPWALGANGYGAGYLGE